MVWMDGVDVRVAVVSRGHVLVHPRFIIIVNVLYI